MGGNDQEYAKKTRLYNAFCQTDVTKGFTYHLIAAGKSNRVVFPVPVIKPAPCHLFIDSTIHERDLPLPAN